MWKQKNSQRLVVAISACFMSIDGEDEELRGHLKELLSLGFEITEVGKHYKITYRGDPRYMVTVGKTPSDNRSGNNNAALISKTML